MVTYIISKKHRQSQLIIVWQNMTENAGRISVLPEKREIHHIIPTALICQWNIPPIFLTHSTYRMNFRPFILPVRYSIHFFENNYQSGKQPLLWFAKLQRIINCRIIRCLQLIQYARRMAILRENILFVQNVEKKRRFTAELPVIIVRFRTGMMERARNIRIVPYMISYILI